MLGGGEGLGLSAGGLEELAERRADMAAAYEDDMFNWSLKNSITAEDGPK